jgi:signal transduction histidine kinase
VDLALFGEETERFVDRFADPLAGEALLARALAEGAAEGRALLVTGAGARAFRISLWRQRGGDKVRLVAAFAALAEAGAPAQGGLAQQAERIAHDIQAPLGALIASGDALRAEAAAPRPERVAQHAADITAATWRVLRLAGDLLDLAASGGRAGHARAFVEVDLHRVLGRARRMALAEAAAAEVALEPLAVQGAGPLPGVLSDESLLGGVIDDLLRHAIRAAGEGGAVRVAIEGTAERGLAVAIRSAAAGSRPARRARAGIRLPGTALPRPDAALRELAALAGGTLDLEAGTAGDVQARLGFSPARCLEAAGDA